MRSQASMTDRPNSGAGSDSGEIRSIIIAATLANLCYLRVWRWTVFATESDLFLCKIRPGPQDVAASALGVLILTAILWPAVRLARRRNSRAASVARVVLLGAFALAIASLTGIIPVSWNIEMASYFGSGKWVLFKLGFLAGAFLAMLAGRERSIRVGCSAMLLLSPFTAITFARAIQHYVSTAPAPAAPAFASHDGCRPVDRVVWVIFDEWDYRLTFVDRPAGLSLPNIDRLAAESLSAGRAVSPAPNTFLSVPSLLLGRVLTNLDPISPNAAIAKVEGEERSHPYSQKEDIFAASRKKGYTTAAAGWYLPYCRMFAGELTNCDWSGPQHYLVFSSIAPSRTQTVTDLLARQTKALLTLNGSESQARREHAQVFASALARGREYAADSSIDVVFLHMPAPHLPGICRDLALRGCPADPYVGNLLVMDMALGALRAAIDSPETREHTALVVSSDHRYRHSEEVDGKTDPRVPFLLRLPGGDRGALYGPRFNTVVTKELVLALLDGRIKSLPDAVEWLDTRAAASLRHFTTAGGSPSSFSLTGKHSRD
jgi:hypothetical protein